MMRTYTLLALLAASFALFSGCKKDDEKLSKKELITRSPWKLRSWASDPAFPNGTGATVADRYAQLQPCDADDLLTFTTEFKFTQEEGASKCNPSNPQIYASGTWTLSSDESTLSLSGGGGSQEFKIENLSNDELKVTFIQSDGVSTTNYKQTQVYGH